MIKDFEYMQLALALAEKARITAPPNPWVGCVIVKDDAVVGEGYTQPPGGDHAEVVALKRAGTKTAGATLYVTLEPCSHYGRTPPCCKAIPEAGIRRIVIGIVDPDSRVAGEGIRYLELHGADVVVGIAAEQIKKLLAPYIFHRTTGRPYVVGKGAISIDGRVAAPDKTSKWITPPEARADSHRLRAESQAILIGVGTAIADAPLLTVRDTNPLPSEQPLRVVLDSKGTLPKNSLLLNTALAPTLIATTTLCEGEQIKEWEKCGAEILILPPENGQVPLFPLLQALGEQGIVQLLVEGGGHVMESFLRQQLIQRFVTYVGPRVIGAEGIPLFGSFSASTIELAPEFIVEHAIQIGNSVRIDYKL